MEGARKLGSKEVLTSSERRVRAESGSAIQEACSINVKRVMEIIGREVFQAYAVLEPTMTARSMTTISTIFPEF